MNKPDCYNCTYFFVTWQAHAPRGCKAFGFKTKNLPSMEVLKISGKDCVYYTPKREIKPVKKERYV
jgi:hypothetical protein